MTRCNTCREEIVLGEPYHSEEWQEYGPIEHEKDFGWLGMTTCRVYHNRCLPGHVLRAAKGITHITGAARLGVQEVK
jgi:hypothetical protein